MPASGFACSGGGDLSLIADSARGCGLNSPLSAARFDGAPKRTRSEKEAPAPGVWPRPKCTSAPSLRPAHSDATPSTFIQAKHAAAARNPGHHLGYVAKMPAELSHGMLPPSGRAETHLLNGNAESVLRCPSRWNYGSHRSRWPVLMALHCA